MNGRAFFLLSLLVFTGGVTASRACDLAVDPITSVGIPYEQNSLTDNPADTKILIVDTGVEINLKAFWGVDKNGDGKIEGSKGEWDDLSTAADPNIFANKKMSELTSRDTAFNITNLLHSLFNPDPAGRIRGAHVTFNTDDFPAGEESAVIKDPGALDAKFPFNKGSGDLSDYPVNTVTPEACPELDDCFYITPWDFFSMAGAEPEGFVKDNTGAWVPIGTANPVADDPTYGKIRLVESSATDISCDGTPSWMVPTDAWGTDWDIDTSGTAYFPDRDAFIANNGGMSAVNTDAHGTWITTPGRSEATFSFATPTEPRCFFIQADGWFTFVLDNVITFKWRETVVPLNAAALSAAPFNLTIAAGDVVTSAMIDTIKDKIKNDPTALAALGMTASSTKTYGMKMLVAIKKVGREARRQRFGRRKILVRDKVGAFWAGYGTNVSDGHAKHAALPSMTMSDGALDADGPEKIAVQLLTRNPYFDTALPTEPIEGVDAVASEANKRVEIGYSTFVPGTFAAELWVLVQDVEKYVGVHGPLCQAYAGDGKWGVTHGKPGEGGSCDCFAVPVPRFVWKRVDLVKPGGGGAVDISEFKVYRFNHASKQASGDLCDLGDYSGLTQGAGSIPDEGTLQTNGETGKLGSNSFFSVVEFEMPTDIFATHRPGLHYGPGSKEYDGTVKDILGRDLGATVKMPAWPDDEANLPLRYMVVVTNPGTGYAHGMARPDGSLCSGASDGTVEIPADMEDLKQYVQGGGKRFISRLAHHADARTAVFAGATAQIGFTGWASNLLWPEGLAVNWRDAAGGYGHFGHYTVTDDIKPELYFEVNTTYDGHFLFGDRRASVCAHRADYRDAAESKGEAASGSNEDYVLDDVALFDNANEEWIYADGLDDPANFQAQKALVAAGTFCPANFGFELPSGWSGDRTGLWVNEDTDLVFRVVARDNLNFYLPPTDSNPAGLDQAFVSPSGSSDPLHSHPRTWVVHDGPRGKELRADAGGAEQGEAFPRYTFRKPNVPAPASGDAACHVQAEVRDQAGNRRSLRLNFGVFDTKSGYYQLEERRQKGEADDTGSSDWWN